MDFRYRTLILVGLIVIVGILVIAGLNTRRAVNNQVSSLASATPPLSSIRIGYQIPWATEGQLNQILKNTDVLAKHGLKGDFKGFNSGAPLNEAALGGNVDVIFTADQPAATLLTKSKEWTIIGRLMYNRVSLYVPPKSLIKTVADLKGKTVGMPFGAAAQRMALQEEISAGLNPKTDVKNVNLAILEQSDLVRDPNAVKWGTFDALAGFDPTPAIFESKGLTRNLATGKIVSVIVMSNQFITNNPTAPTNFLKAFNDAYDFYRNNQAQANQWFITDSKLKVSDDILKVCASIEPNISVTDEKDIRLSFTDDDYRIMQEAADFIYDEGLVQEKVDMKQYVNLTYLDQAEQ